MPYYQGVSYTLGILINMIIVHLLVFLGLFVVYLPSVLNPTYLRGFTYGDPEIAAYIAHLIGKGARLYQDFAMVYGPGRFVLLAGLNTLFKVPMSIPLLSAYSTFMGTVLVPFCIYLLTYTVVKEPKLIVRIPVSLGAMLSYLLLLRAGQDTHAALLLCALLYAWHTETKTKWSAALAGALLVLPGIFRIEAGIITLIAVIATELLFHTKDKTRPLFIGSYLVALLAYGGSILLHGSIPQFLHDTVQLGIISQPKVMKVLIQPVDYPLFEFFLILNLAAAFLAVASRKKSVLFLALLNLLSFANALGRADFDHLYYGLTLAFPTFLVATIVQLSEWKTLATQKITYTQIAVVLATILCIVFIIKKQSVLLLLGCVPLVVGSALILKKQTLLVALILLLLSFHTLVRSQSLFTFYAKRQFSLLPVSGLFSRYKTIPEFFGNVRKGNYGGLQLSKQDTTVLTQMKRDLEDKTLFVYPSNATLYFELGKQPPVRYIYFNNEYTNQMEEETIQALQQKKVEYVLVSQELTKPDAIVKNQTLRIASYIAKTYQKTAQYRLGNDTFVLLKKK